MATFTTTAKYALRWLTGANLISDIDAGFQALAEDVDANVAGYSSGTLAALPAAGKAGRLYRTTDTGQWFADTGSAWVEVDLVGSRGKSIIATSESRTNTAYGMLTTPDRVQNVVLPTDGLILVAFQALWQQSIGGTAKAAIFLGANQLRFASTVSGTNQLAEAQMGSGSATDVPLFSYAGGLFGSAQSANAATDVTTGQIVGGEISSTAGVLGGGFCAIFAAAGTYDVSVQFKASSGSVTARNRKLWVRALTF